MNGVRIADDVTPTNAGEYSWHSYASRTVHHPDESGDGEWWVCDPNGEMYRLIRQKHSWAVHENGSVTISPSIVAPRGSYHGFLHAGVWS